MAPHNVSMLATRLIIATVALTTLMAACAPRTGAPPSAPDRPPASPEQMSPPAPKVGGTLRMATVGGLARIHHVYPEPQHSTAARRNAATLLYANLIDVDWNTLDFVADPRRSMAQALPTVSTDGRTYTFALRPDLQWSDGAPITAEDFRFAFEQASKRDNNYVGLLDLERIETLVTPTPHTLVITLQEPLARSLALSVFEDRVRPLPRHIWEGRPWYDPNENPEVTKPSVVSGPYLLKDADTDAHTYVRNPLWWGKQPNLDTIVFVAASPNTVVELLRTRQVDWAEVVPPAQFDDLKRLPEINPIEMAGAIGTYRIMQFNLARPVLADRRVREALVRAIHRVDLIQFEDDLAVPQPSLFPQNNTRWVNAHVEPYDPDLKLAQRLLEEAGFRLDAGALVDPAGRPVRLDILWPTSSQPRGKMAAYLQQQWRHLGITATVTGLDFAAFTDRYQRQHDFDIAMGTFSAATFDPDSAKSQLRTDGAQNTGYSNPRVDQLFEQGAIEQSEARRKAIYDEIQRLAIADLPIYYMLTTKDPTAFDKKVAGVAPLKGGHILRQNNLQVLDWYINTP